MSRSGAPLLVEVTRGDSVESWHEVDAVVVGTDGTVVDSWGDTARRVLPRSATRQVLDLGVDFGDPVTGLGRKEGRD